MAANRTVRIGCYSAAWGDSAMSAPQLLKGGNIKYLVGDLLAEVTMAILASKKARDPSKGYATDFVWMMKDNMKEIKRQGVKVVVNAGGINPEACRDAVLAHAKKQGIDLKIGVVMGDDIMSRQDELREKDTREMFSGKAFPSKKELMSCSAYLGAFPIAEALKEGCEVVITGRVVDSAVVLGPLIYEFGWGNTEYDKLAAGTLAGHLVECGPQCCGGLFTDYEAVESWVNIGYPIVEVQSDGIFTVQKPPGTDGLVSFGTVCEQMLYEIGDPGAYHVPDVACDFTQVQYEEIDTNVVRVTNVRGQPPTNTYKVCATFSNGFTWTPTFTFVGHDAARKAKRVASTLLTRWRAILKRAGAADFSEVRIETIGAGQFFRQDNQGREAFLRVAVRHKDRKALSLVSREWACSGTSFAQGQCGGGGGFGVQSTVSAFLFLVPKEGVENRVIVDGKETTLCVPTNGGFVRSASETVVPVPAEAPASGKTVRVSLLDLCWARSGDKADYANIGLIARRPEYLPVLRQQVTAERVKEYFAHNLKGDVKRFDLPGSSSMNFLLFNSLGGGGTSSLHSDGLAKTYGQVLLQMEIDAPIEWANHPRLLNHRGTKHAPLTISKL
eukprot:gnl/TRDRNA2_/TRDRNA2_198706_c0_seq1.p1 gnl/TRDRNA2_/TRDRNA2_198706_c0~~gnl/TRDRNA2_/TRDRNA2_198706_c0_seq1.p1  ORF type:complete len:613 (-),score=120.33 gnl/TRDRNA2_/TRDRNA2_198706_c0_seq1:135-1973(-)